MTNQLDNLTQYLCTSLQHYRISEYTWGYELRHLYLKSAFKVSVSDGKIFTDTEQTYQVGKKRMGQVVEAIRQGQGKEGEAI